MVPILEDVAPAAAKPAKAQAAVPPSPAKAPPAVGGVKLGMVRRGSNQRPGKFPNM